MAQTGVPFGEVNVVRDWLKIRGTVHKPASEHPKRPVQGFDCPRSEVSGRRLWGWIQSRYGTPEAFFSECFVANYCPLIFMEESARNRVPEKLPVSERRPLLERCDQALREIVDELRPEWVVGVGAWSRKRAQKALGSEARVHQILHPSPASPLANQGWGAQVDVQVEPLALPGSHAVVGRDEAMDDHR